MSNGIRPLSTALTNFFQDSLGFKVQSTQQTIPNNVFFGVGLWNPTGPGGWSSGQLNLDDGIFIVPVTGYYHTSATVVFAENSTGTRGAQINVGPLATFEVTIPASSGGTTSVPIPGGILFLQAGQQVALQAFQDSGGGFDIEGNTAWSMFLHQRS